MDFLTSQRVLLREAMLLADKDGSLDRMSDEVRSLLLRVTMPLTSDPDGAELRDARLRAEWAEEMQRVQRLHLDRIESIADRVFAANGGKPRRYYNRFANLIRDNAADIDAIEAALGDPS